MTRIAPLPRARMGRSRLGGVATALPPPLAFAEGQLPLALGPAPAGKDAGHGRRETCAPGAHLGLHQDGEEPSDAPVVTLCIGDSCVFRFAGVGRRTGPFTDLELRSGDLLVFGEPNRRIYHGVPKVLDGTAPGGLGLPPGRLSITVRETGL